MMSDNYEVDIVSSILLTDYKGEGKKTRNRTQKTSKNNKGLRTYLVNKHFHLQTKVMNMLVFGSCTIATMLSFFNM